MKFAWSITLAPYLHWKLDAGMPVSMAQCCPFFQNQPVVECSYTVDTLQDRISGSRLPWPLLHSLFPFLPSSRFSLCSFFTAFRYTATPSTALYTCVCKCICVIMCVSVLWATLSFISRDSNPVFGPCCCLIAFVLFTLPALRHWYHQVKGLPPILDPLMDSSHGFRVFHPPLRGPPYLFKKNWFIHRDNAQSTSL